MSNPSEYAHNFELPSSVLLFPFPSLLFFFRFERASIKSRSYLVEEPFAVYHHKQNDEPCFRRKIYPVGARDDDTAGDTRHPFVTRGRGQSTAELNLKNYTPVHVANRSFVISHGSPSRRRRLSSRDDLSLLSFSLISLPLAHVVATRASLHAAKLATCDDYASSSFRRCQTGSLPRSIPSILPPSCRAFTGTRAFVTVNG